MARFTIQVSDRRGKYPKKTYVVEADQEFLAYGLATEQFIKDNGHRARGPNERISTYYARFLNQPVADPVPEPRPTKSNNPDGRPRVLVGGARKNVYLDDDTIEYATTLASTLGITGPGKLSAGLREAVKIAKAIK